MFVDLLPKPSGTTLPAPDYLDYLFSAGTHPPIRIMSHVVGGGGGESAHTYRVCMKEIGNPGNLSSYGCCVPSVHRSPNGVNDGYLFVDSPGNRRQPQVTGADVGALVTWYSVGIMSRVAVCMCIQSPVGESVSVVRAPRRRLMISWCQNPISYPR